MTLTALVLFATACGGTLGDLGGILGSPSVDQASDVNGVVDFVDTNARRIELDVRYINNLRNDQQNQSIYYDDRTRVVYDNREFAVNQLERGDQVSIRGVNDGGRYVAETITVTYDATR